MHWGPPARAIVFAMPLTLGILALLGAALFPRAELGRGVPAGGRAHADGPRRHLGRGDRAARPGRVRHTLNLESGLNDGLALPFVLFFLVLATPGGDAGAEGAKLLGEAAFGAVMGAALGIIGGRLHRLAPAGGITARYEGIFAVGLGVAAYGLADLTFGNGLIAAFVAGIALGATEHEIPDRFHAFSENVSSIFQVMTFFVFGALIVAMGYDGVDPGADRVHPPRAAGRAAGRAADLAARHRLPAPRARVHGLVRAEGRRLDAVRADRARVTGRPRLPDLQGRGVRDPLLDPRPRAHRHGRSKLDRAPSGPTT